MAMCKDIVDNIVEYIESELDYDTLQELEKHSGECPECQAFIRTYKRMLELTGKLRERTFVTPQIRTRLKDFLKSQVSTN